MKIAITGRIFFSMGLVIAISVGLINCTSKKRQLTATDSLTAGIIHISVDESFKPVIDEQIKVFESSYPGAKIIAHYKPEADCLRDILRDSTTRMVIVTRGLTRKEEHYFKDSLNFLPRWDELATDAIAIVVNAKSADTIFTFERLQNQLSGLMGNKEQIIFDGLNATSTVRFAIDSILRGKKFDTSVVMAVNGSKAVLDYVAANQNAIGLVGISWIGNPEDTAQVALLKKVKMVYVKCDNCGDSPYVKPNQLNIMTRRYPLVRGLYFILKENYSGLGSGFLNFLQYERGQLIFRRAYLGSSKMGFAIRNVKINEKLEKE
jgi:phosphate transport system substrate-binding protein